MPDETDVFEQYRPLLLGLGYRLLGSMWDAEDIVQDAYVRWTGVADTATVEEPRAFLVTVVTRLALDQLRSARVTREAYVGPWLPEPVAAAGLGPLDTAELRDTLSYATLHMMERLSPPERAVFVLREGFDLPYDEIARILDVPVAACRQHHHRATGKLAGGRDRFHPSGADHAELVGRFLEAAQSGDLSVLTDLLAEDVTAWNDGGGKVRAALRPIVGFDNVLAFIAGLVERYPLEEARVVEANGEPALRAEMGGQHQIITFDVRDGRIHGIFAVLNPDKLSRIS
ncbi:RNA polymerase sigma-70 factor [Actinomadura oligospora]|uniref:RNA polymerase sigma-70 factor n=1 Tax=Actinomadura oligospora TaxID=111804 RepID=UPI00047E8FB2|nr:RNA polymerase sigma-70 factor [Actinomadura oligospora]